MTGITGGDYAAFLAEEQAYIRQRRAGKTPAKIAAEEILSETLTERVDELARDLLADMAEDRAAFSDALEEYAARAPLAESDIRIGELTIVMARVQGQLDSLREDEVIKKKYLGERQKDCEKLLEIYRQAQAKLAELKKWNPSSIRGFDQMTENASRYGATGSAPRQGTASTRRGGR